MKYLCVSTCLLMLATSAVLAQSTSPSTCVASAVPPLVRVEGIAERMGDLVYHCSGLPNTTLTGNFTITLNVAITNRLSTGSTITGIAFTTDSGSGPQAVVVQPQLVNRNTLVFNGVSFTFSPQGSAELRIAGLRGNASQLIIGAQIIAGLAINGAGLALTTSQLVVGIPQRGLYAGFSTKLIGTQAGSPLPDPINFSSLLAATAFASTRFTEGFADAFGIATDFNGVNADSGQRVIIRYGGFPSDARLFVPDVIAGSDTVQPTAGGDFGPPASGGYYTPSVNGTLLLARVNGAAANGAGGGPVYTPGPFGSGIVSFNTVTELQIINGSAYVVYEVVDSNASSVESAQFPTFLGLPFSSTRSFFETTSSISLAPNSTVSAASLTEPLPRFLGVDPPADCGIIGDCQTALPQLVVDTTPQQLSTTAGGPTVQSLFTIRNGGGGTLRWSATIGYGTTPGWLSLDAYSGSGGVNVRMFAAPGNLVPATYQAAIIIDAGPAGTKTILVTFIVAAVARPTKPTVNAVLNAGSFLGVPVVPGSLTTVTGALFAGNNVSITFDGFAGVILFNDGTQMNVLVPTSGFFGSKTTAQLIVTVDGVSSDARTVQLAPFEPAIFRKGVLNQDYSVNDISNGAPANSIIQIFATGLSGQGTITANLAGREITMPYYAGAAPGLLGVQQVDLVIPPDLGPMNTQVYLCGTDTTGAKVCGLPAPVTLK